MKLSLLGRASYLDRTTGGPCPPVGTTLFQPIAFVKRFGEQELLRFGDRRRVADIFVLDCRSGCSRSL